MKLLSALLLLASSLWAAPATYGDTQTEDQVQPASASVDSADVSIGEVVLPDVIVQQATSIDVLMHRLEASADNGGSRSDLSGAHHFVYEGQHTATLNRFFCSCGQHNLQLANRATDQRGTVETRLLNYNMSGRQRDTRIGVINSP